jgi:DNA-3-methyladenine glycosylase II
MRKNPAKHLAGIDPVMARLIKKIDLRPLRPERNRFKALVEAIISQQLSNSVASSITNRFRALSPGKIFPTPEDVFKTPLLKLRNAGLSLAKANYLKDLARHIVKKEINLRNLHSFLDEEVIESLIKVKGIGRWTAEMFLMFALNRPDVFSAGDLSLRNSIIGLYRFRSIPTPKDLEEFSRRWQPYRTLACRYLWASRDNR